MNAVNLLISWVPVALWAGLIFTLSSIPGLSTGWGLYDLILRKGAHIFEYTVLALLIVRAGHRTWPARPPAWSRSLAIITTLLYAVSDEIHQAFVPRRGPSIWDVVIDGIGIFLAMMIARWWERRSAGEARS